MEDHRKPQHNLKHPAKPAPISTSYSGLQTTTLYVYMLTLHLHTINKQPNQKPNIKASKRTTISVNPTHIKPQKSHQHANNKSHIIIGSQHLKALILTKLNGNLQYCKL
eukprot:gene2814-1799_t